jgi:hypothetical protein
LKQSKYIEQFKPVQFTEDEEFIQDLLLNNKQYDYDTFELVASYILAICVVVFLIWRLL